MIFSRKPFNIILLSFKYNNIAIIRRRHRIFVETRRVLQRYILFTELRRVRNVFIYFLFTGGLPISAEYNIILYSFTLI